MTKTEREKLDRLEKKFSAFFEKLEKDRQNFQEQISDRIDFVEKQVLKTKAPETLEKIVIGEAQKAISIALKNALKSNAEKYIDAISERALEKYKYDIQEEVAESHRVIYKLIGDTYNDAVKEFDVETLKKSIKKSLMHKVSARLVNTDKSLTDKVFNEISKDSALKAKAILAVERTLQEFL